MKPGSSVTSPRSSVRAFWGGVGGLTAMMRSPSTTMTGLSRVRPLITSIIRAARMTSVCDCAGTVPRTSATASESSVRIGARSYTCYHTPVRVLDTILR